MMDKVCANCERFSVVDDGPRRIDDWFGVCGRELEDDGPCRGCGMGRALDWAYDHGRHGRDDCERPDEWFEAVDGDE